MGDHDRRFYLFIKYCLFIQARLRANINDNRRSKHLTKLGICHEVNTCQSCGKLSFHFGLPLAGSLSGHLLFTCHYVANLKIRITCIGHWIFSISGLYWDYARIYCTLEETAASGCARTTKYLEEFYLRGFRFRLISDGYVL